MVSALKLLLQDNETPLGESKEKTLHTTTPVCPFQMPPPPVRQQTQVLPTFAACILDRVEQARYWLIRF